MIMKLRLFTLFCCLTFALMASAQASGGQIRRPAKRQSSSSTATPSHNYTKTYTVKEQYEMGSSYYDKGNYQEAIKWYRKAAELGHPDAQSELGHMYFNGEGVPVNHEEALKWLSKAASQGDAIAQSTLGYMYKNGVGVPKNEDEAAKWFKKSAFQYYEGAKRAMKAGNQLAFELLQTVISMDITPYSVLSMFHMGTLYYYGECDLKTDFSQAFYYFKQASEKGNLPALYYLGLCYEYGRGVPEDKTKAQEYYKRSGYKSAPSRNF